MTCRKRRDDVETAGVSLTRDKLRRRLFTDRSGVRQLLSAAGADGEDTESKRWGKEAGHTDRIGSDCADGGEVETGAGGGPAVPSGFLRVSTGEVGAGCSGAGAAAMLAL